MDLSHRAPEIAHFGPLFEYGHLPPWLQEISGPSTDLAAVMVANLSDGPELAFGLRQLLLAKDAFVRAALAIAPRSS